MYSKAFDHMSSEQFLDTQGACNEKKVGGVMVQKYLNTFTLS